MSRLSLKSPQARGVVAMGYSQKPFDDQALVEFIHDVLEKKEKVVIKNAA